MDHLLQLLAGDLPFFGVRFLIDETLELDRVGGIEEQQALARQPVAAGAPGLLIIALDVLRQIVVQDEAHVGLVDAHAEGDRRADDAHLIAQETLLLRRAVLGGHAGVITAGRDPVRLQVRGEGVGRLAAQTVDDPAVFPALVQEGARLAVGAGLDHHPIQEVRAVEARDIAARVAEPEERHDVLAHALGSGRRQGHDRHAREVIAQLGELAVLGPEIVSPFADAMGLVDRDETDRPAPEVRQDPGHHEPFGRQIQESEAVLA